VYNPVRAPYIVRPRILPAEAYGVMRGFTYSGVQLTHSFARWGRSMIWRWSFIDCCSLDFGHHDQNSAQHTSTIILHVYGLLGAGWMMPFCRVCVFCKATNTRTWASSEREWQPRSSSQQSSINCPFRHWHTSMKASICQGLNKRLKQTRLLPLCPESLAAYGFPYAHLCKATSNNRLQQHEGVLLSGCADACTCAFLSIRILQPAEQTSSLNCSKPTMLL